MAATLLVGLLLPAPPAQARDADHERARAAAQAGQVMPLRAVLDKLAATHPGEVLEVELENDDGRWLYEIKLLQPDGQLRKLKLDARTAQVLQTRLRGAAPRPLPPAAPTTAPTAAPLQAPAPAPLPAPAPARASAPAQDNPRP